MADHVHHIDLCDECDGLRTVRLDLIPDADVYMGPLPGPCPNRTAAADG